MASFKVPTSLELRHDFLWRCHAKVPPRGMIGIFNRSHYEDVLSPRVHGALTEKQVQGRFDDIKAWEKTLADNDVLILKFFLQISRKYQTQRFHARIYDPYKHWKLSLSDFQERHYWDDYMDAYQDIFRETSHKHAPWFIIPADHKWYRNVAISRILVEALDGLKLDYPKPTFDPAGMDLKTESPGQVAKQATKRFDPEAPAATSKRDK